MNDRTKDYVFLSYSHEDDISDLIKEFDKHNYNIVYDRAIKYGEDWDLVARRYISNSKCKGVIFVVSYNSLISRQILKEVEYTNKFNKNYFSYLYQNKTHQDIKKQLWDKSSEKEKYIMDCIIEAFPEEQIYVTANDLDWVRVKEVFSEWGLKNDDLPIQVSYTTDMKGEKERLNNQQKGYYEFDKKAIDLVMKSFDRKGLCVLDIGCSNGGLTISRFAEEPKISKVIGVDYNAGDIAQAKKSAEAYGDKFAFYTVDLEEENVIENLNKILSDEGVEKVDIVFGALVLHHLKKPSKLLLQLYDIMKEDGKIIMRGSDDGGKLCYPKSELLEEILTRYGKLVTASDRSNGRKLYSQLYNAGYVGIQMMYSVADTCEKDRRSRERLFDIGFSFRLNRIDELIKSNPNQEGLKKEREWFKDALAEFKEAFVERSFWYCNISYIAIAGVNEWKQ